MKRDYILYLEDIIESINNIENYIKGICFESFIQDKKTIDAVIRNFEIIGEASKKIPSEIKDNYQNIPWNLMSDMRNVLIHEYFGIQLDIIWKTIKERLPELKISIQEIIEKIIK